MTALLRLLYLPFGIVAGQISKRLGARTFDALWTKVDDRPPAPPGSGASSAVKTVTGRALRAGVMAGSAAAVDRAFAHAFHYFIGIYPKKAPKPED